MSERKWNIIVLVGTSFLLLLIMGATIFIDPFWHYHGGQGFLEYPLKYERYQNDGIARHCEYDAIITGTSMTQNFKCSEFDELWGVKTIKISNSGATFRESAENIERALNYNNQVKYVLCSLDGNRINESADALAYEGYPEYLYDNNPFNDVKYLLNKEVVTKSIAVLSYTRSGQETTSMDEYGHWGRYKLYGAENVINTFELAEISEEVHSLSESAIQRIQENVDSNFVELAQKYPDTTFYLFVPPYSICYWEALYRTKQLNCGIDERKIAMERLLNVENIRIYDFSHNISMIENLDNYTDSLHYGEWINSEILQMIHNDEGRITKDNYLEYYNNLYEVFSKYDYAIYRK